MKSDNTALAIMVKRAASFGQGTTKSAADDNMLSRVSDWYSILDPGQKALARGLAGATVGGVTSTLLAGRSPDPEDRRHRLAPALMGATLGGLGAAALPEGLRLVSNLSGRTPSKLRPSPLASTGRFVDNNAVTLAAGTGAALASHGAIGALIQGMRASTVRNPAKRFVDALAQDRWHNTLGNAANAMKKPKALSLALLPLALAGGFMVDRALKGNT